MPERRVAITGIGPVSAIGTGREAFFDAVKHRRSGVAEITLFDAEPYRCQHAAEITDRPVSVEDYAATVYHALGMAPRKVYHMLDGRPSESLPAGKAIPELIG